MMSSSDSDGEKYDGAVLKKLKSPPFSRKLASIGRQVGVRPRSWSNPDFGIGSTKHARGRGYSHSNDLKQRKSVDAIYHTDSIVTALDGRKKRNGIGVSREKRIERSRDRDDSTYHTWTKDTNADMSDINVHDSRTSFRSLTRSFNGRSGVGIGIGRDIYLEREGNKIREGQGHGEEQEMEKDNLSLKSYDTGIRDSRMRLMEVKNLDGGNKDARGETSEKLADEEIAGVVNERFDNDQQISSPVTSSRQKIGFYERGDVLEILSVAGDSISGESSPLPENSDTEYSIDGRDPPQSSEDCIEVNYVDDAITALPSRVIDTGEHNIVHTKQPQELSNEGNNFAQQVSYAPTVNFCSTTNLGQNDDNREIDFISESFENYDDYSSEAAESDCPSSDEFYDEEYENHDQMKDHSRSHHYQRDRRIQHRSDLSVKSGSGKSGWSAKSSQAASSVTQHRSGRGGGDNILPLSIAEILDDGDSHRSPGLCCLRTKYGWCCGHMRKSHWSGRISSAVVRYAPCFWCSATQLQTNATDRMVLQRLNIIYAFSGLAQMGVGIFFTVVLLAQDVEVNLFKLLNSTILLVFGSFFLGGALGIILLVSSFWTIRVIQEVNLSGWIRYYWILYWLLPLQVFCVIALIDYGGLTKVWVEHWWTTPSMKWFRKMYCPASKMDECIATTIPFTDTRDKAQQSVHRFIEIFTYSNLTFDIILVLLLLLGYWMLRSIISEPIVQRSKQSNIPLWLTLPAAGCLMLGFLTIDSTSLLNDDNLDQPNWIEAIPNLFIVAGVAFSMSVLLGWFNFMKGVFNTQDKMLKQITVYLYILVIIIAIVSVASILIGCSIFSFRIFDLVEDESGEIGKIACNLSNKTLIFGCTGCNSTNIEDQCPEWDKEDISIVLQAILKVIVSISAIFLIYPCFALHFGFEMRLLLSQYEIDYV